MRNLVDGNPELAYFAIGGVSAFVMAIFRTQKWTRKRFAMRLVEGVMCSMLSSAISIGIVQYFDVSFIWSIPIGTFMGFIGTDLIHMVIVGLITYNAMKLKQTSEELIDEVKHAGDNDQTS